MEELLRYWMVERLIAAEEKGKKEMNDTYKDALEELNRSSNNSPIVIQRMTFNVFPHYMSTKKSKNYGGYFNDTGYGGVLSSLSNLFYMSGKTIYRGFKK